MQKSAEGVWNLLEMQGLYFVAELKSAQRSDNAAVAAFGCVKEWGSY
jgi:hypothetical protein